jgi:hypothetical protein
MKNQNSDETWSTIVEEGSKMTVVDDRESLLTLRILDSCDQIEVKGVQIVAQDDITLPKTEASVAKFNNSRKAGWIQFSGGLNLWNEGYGSSSPERSAYESTLPSYFGRIGYQHVLHSGWTISAGIQYIRLQSEFERTFDIENYTIVLKDTIIKVETNSLTGEHQTIRGDLELEVPAKRRVRHFNSIQNIQLPIELGKRWSKRRFGAEVAGGPIFNLYSQRRGRNSVNDELLIYGGSGKPIFNNQLHVSAMIAGRIQYRITPMFELSLGIQYQQSISNWSGETGVTMRPQIFLTEIGIRQRIY